MTPKITARRIRDGRRLARRVLPYIIRVARPNTGWRFDNLHDHIEAELEAFFIAALPRHQTIYITDPEQFISAAIAELKNEAGVGRQWTIRRWRENVA